MSIYFYHVFEAYFALVLLLALAKVELKDFCVGFCIGTFIALAAFKIAQDNLAIDELNTFACILAIAALVAPLYLFRFRFLKIICLSILFFSFYAIYRAISIDFRLFGGELLDTLSIVSFGFTLLAFTLLGLFYALIRTIETPKRTAIALFVVISLFCALKLLAHSLLELMRFGVIETGAWTLSLIAKAIYYGAFLPYFYAALIVVLLALKAKTPLVLPIKKIVGSIEFRRAKARLERGSSKIKSAIALLVISCATLLYFDLYASRPPTISEAVILEPIDDEFIINVSDLADNDLHRFAYITDEGIKIRFFAINRFKDKTSPVVVYDACMICGDMGYIKKQDEIICVSCNVRIFLSSIGKEGGCNPIPFPFEFDGEYVSVKFDELVKGAHYFNEIVEKEVRDPVSGAKLINLKAPFSYEYGVRTYFFESEENYRLFIENPEAYVAELKQAYYRTQGFIGLKGDNEN
jgi:uncharacterized membrane protein/YHS domain-containing protein